MTAHPASAALSRLVRAFGGDLSAGGRRALVPAPGHSAQDRSVSLLLQEGRLVVHCFGGADWKEVLDDLRARGWIDAENRLLEGGAPVRDDRRRAPDLTRVDRIAAARRLWDAGGPIGPGTPAGLYAVRRGVDLKLATAGALRAHAAAPAWAYRDRGVRRPALLAAVRDAAGKLTAVEVSYLDQRGRRSAAARLPRKIIGVLPEGGAVRLALKAEAMVVGEGVFTTLSAMRRFGRPGWALLSTTNLRRWAPPEGVRHVIVAGDRGADGERSAELLCNRLTAAGCGSEVALPPEGYGDWNDLDQEEARRKGGQGRPDRGDGP